jgi:hypothetical protein
MTKRSHPKFPPQILHLSILGMSGGEAEDEVVAEYDVVLSHDAPEGLYVRRDA